MSAREEARAATGRPVRVVRGAKSAPEIVVYAGFVSEPDEDGRRFWAAGSASGPLLAGWRVQPIEVGDRFEHWELGSVEVVRVNRKSLSLRNGSGRIVRLAL